MAVGRAEEEVGAEALRLASQGRIVAHRIEAIDS